MNSNEKTLEMLINSQANEGITFNRFISPDNTLRGANLGGANLRGANLGDADLRDANLRGADLRGANLGGADLRGANLGDADLRDANLRGANLRGANLGDADLRDANLTLPIDMTSGNFDIQVSSNDNKNTYHAGCFSGTAPEMIAKTMAVRNPKQSIQCFYRCLSFCVGAPDEQLFLDAIEVIKSTMKTEDAKGSV